MKWATSRLYKNRKLFLIIAGLVIPLLLFALQLDQKTFVARPLQEVFYTPFWSISNKLAALVNVYNNNMALKSENVRLKFERMTFEQNRLEDQRFREMLRLLPRPDYKLISADVIGYDQGRRWSSAIIRASEYIDQFLPVVDEKGLVGKIASSTGTVATVSLLIGPNCRVAARDNQTRTLGIIKWNTGRRLLLDGVAVESDVFPGDTIISSGMGGVFPEGLTVGVVAKVDTIPTEVFKQVVVEPFVDFGSLDNVMVMKPLSGSFGN
jgi:rod shape-determining protein MreC